MPTFDYSFTVNSPLAAVNEFHHDTSALKKLTPPPTYVHLRDIQPLGEGSVSRFTIWLGPLPLHWTAVHRGVSKNGFTDVQVDGPAQKWEHTHAFRSVTNERTSISEHIDFEHKRGFWGALTRLLFARASLHMLFTYRKLATRWYLRDRIRDQFENTR